MAHRLTYTTTPPLEEDAVVTHISSSGRAIYDAFVADGRITSKSSTEPDEETGVWSTSLTFVDSTACDAYFADMEAINEANTSGVYRSNMVREDI